MRSSVRRTQKLAYNVKSLSSLSMVTTDRPKEKESQVEKRNLMEQISAAGIASAAVVAAAAVNSAVG